MDPAQHKLAILSLQRYPGSLIVSFDSAAKQLEAVADFLPACLLCLPITPGNNFAQVDML
jgi:hypothetical protein